MSSTSPTQRTLAHCRKLGYATAIVEHWQPFWCGKADDGAMLARGGVRNDLFGMFDVLALHEHRTYAIQTTATGSTSARRDKIEEAKDLSAVLAAGWLVEVWGWAKRGKAGSRKLWTLRRERLVGPGTWDTVDGDDASTLEDEEEQST